MSNNTNSILIETAMEEAERLGTQWHIEKVKDLVANNDLEELYDFVAFMRRDDGYDHSDELWEENEARQEQHQLEQERMENFYDHE